VDCCGTSELHRSHKQRNDISSQECVCRSFCFLAKTVSGTYLGCKWYPSPVVSWSSSISSSPRVIDRWNCYAIDFQHCKHLQERPQGLTGHPSLMTSSACLVLYHTKNFSKVTVLVIRHFAFPGERLQCSCTMPLCAPL